MKIAVDIRSLLDENYSGVSEYSFNLLKKLLEIDKENEYIFFLNSFSVLPKKLENFTKNINFIHLRYPNKIFNYGMQNILKTPKIDKLWKDVDLFFMPHINFISLSKQVKKIITIHDLSFLRNKNFFSLKKNLWHKMLAIKKLINEFDHIIAISENTKNDIINFFQIPESKISVIYSGVSSEFIEINRNNQNLKKIKLKYSLAENFILYLGTIEPRKNIEGLIKAYEKFLDLKKENYKYDLILAGAWGWKCNKIKKIWYNSKYKNKIKFLGYIDREEKKYLYNLSNLFVYPSFYEGFGFPPLEALFSGSKIVASFSSSIPEISKNSFTLINPYDINSISTGIQKAIKTPKVSKKNLQDIKMELNWGKAASAYLDLFQKIK